MNQPTALVTAGGTREAIDDVRFVTNLSRGRFPAAIANELATRRIATTLLAAPALRASDTTFDPRVRVVPFDSARSLQHAIHTFIETHGPPDYLFMGAAVSDYTPVRTHGKLSSKDATLELRLERTPKILDTLRELCPKTCIVGFKLLSGVSRDTLVHVAQQQNIRARLDLTVANDLQDLRSNTHPIVLVSAHSTIAATGHRNDVAHELVSHVLAQHRTRTLRFKRPYTQGEPVSGLGLVTERAAHTFNVASHNTPPSLVTHAFLYDALPTLHALIEDPGDLGVYDVTTPTTFPNDSEEEARNLLALLTRALFTRPDRTALLIRRRGAGQLLALFNRRALNRLKSARIKAVQQLRHRPMLPASTCWRPLFHGHTLIGLSARGVDWHTFALLPEFEESHADTIIEQLETIPRCVLTAPDSPLEAMLADRAFVREADEHGARRWRPPCMRDDLVPAASIALFDVVGRRVLLGRRKVGAWPDYLAFPGGKVEMGESTLEAGLRELEEETGISADPKGEHSATTVYVGTEGRAFSVTNHLVLTTRAEEPRESEELESAWFSLETARALRPMAAGTRRVLRRLEALTR